MYSWPLAGEVTWPYICEGVQYKIKTKTSLQKTRQIQSGLNHGGPANGSVVSKKNACLESLGITIMKADNYGRKSRTDMMIVIKKSYDGKECGRA